MPLTIPAVWGFIDFSEANLQGGAVLTDDTLMKIWSNANFGAVRCERIYCGFFKNGDQVPTPVSPADGYIYTSEEVAYECELYTNQAPYAYFTSGQALPPVGGTNSQDGHIYWTAFNLDDQTGTISCVVSYRVAGGKENQTTDGTVKVWAICQRGSVSPYEIIQLAGGAIPVVPPTAPQVRYPYYP